MNPIPSQNSPVGLSANDPNLLSHKKFIVLFIILAASFVVYLPSLQSGYVNWDDQANIYRNTHLLDITDWSSFLTSIQKIFTSHVVGNYNPLPILTFAAEKMIFGLERPEWMHFDNIILHLICVSLVFRIALALGLELIPAGFCALLFGIHPMRVESVAWITERKDVLYGAFFLIALYYYVKSVKSSFSKRYSFIILISFILALLSKIQAVTLPLSMLLVDYYFDRKSVLKLICEKWLYFALSTATGAFGIYLLKMTGNIERNNIFSLFERIFIGSYSYVAYIVKSVVPFEMVPVYPYPAALEWIHYSSILVAAGVLALIWWLHIKGEKLAVFGLLFFTVNIMFMLQILGAGQGFMADRFTYIAYLGLFLIYASAFQRAYQTRHHVRIRFCAGAILVLAVYGILNFQQNGIWKNGETLWTHVLNHYPATPLAWENRASYYGEEGRLAEAVNDYSRAIALQPHNPLIYVNRGNVYLHSTFPDRLEHALADFTMAIRYSPGESEYYIKRGRIYSELNQSERALMDLKHAEKIDPSNKDVYFFRSRIYLSLARNQDALTDIESYLKLDPDNPAMWSNLGTVARLEKNYEKSLKAFNRAIQLNPDGLDYYYKRSMTHYEAGRIDLARKDLELLQSRGYQNINPEYRSILKQDN